MAQINENPNCNNCPIVKNLLEALKNQANKKNPIKHKKVNLCRLSFTKIELN